MADFTPTFDNPQMTDWPAGTNPGPPAAPAPAAAPGVAPADAVLGRDPAYQAFKRALGLEDTTATNNTQAQVDALNRQEPISEQWLGFQNGLANKRISGSMEARGIYRSGETNTNLGNQAAAYGHSVGALKADTANRIAALQQALAQQETGFGTRDAEQQQAAYDRQAFAQQQATLNDQLTKALAAGSTLPDLQSLLPGGVNTALPKGDGGGAANGIVKAAMSWQGTPYQWGGGHGGTLHAGQAVDCSGLVQQVFAENGIRISGTAADMQRMGQAVPTLAQAQPGDLVFYGSPAHHVGIYIGNGQMIDAPHAGAAVRTENVASFGSDFSGIRRVASGLGQLTTQGQVM